MQKQNIFTSSDLCSNILQETGVALLPGLAFGMNDNYLVARLSYIDFDDPLQNENLPEGEAGFHLERDCPKIIRRDSSIEDMDIITIILNMQ